MLEKDVTRIALDYLDKAVFVSNDMTFKTKSVCTVDKETLRRELPLLTEIAKNLSAFETNWNSSKTVGKGAFQQSDNIMASLDVKLFLSGKLDFNQMKKVMYRRIGTDLVIRSINYIERHIDSYQACSEKLEVKECINASKTLLEFISQVKNRMESETNDLKRQLDNVNLFYQNFMVSKAVMIAALSLAISSGAVLLTILQALHII